MSIKKCLVIIIGTIQIIFGATLPTLSGKTLANTTVNIPNQKTPMVLIIGFDMNSSQFMTEWVQVLDLTPSSHYNWLQIAVVGRVPPFIDGFIKKGMKKAVKKKNHAYYLPYFGNQKDRLVKILNNGQPLQDKVAPFVAVISESGEIKWSFQSKVTTENRHEVMAKIETVLSIQKEN